MDNLGVSQIMAQQSTSTHTSKTKWFSSSIGDLRRNRLEIQANICEIVRSVKKAKKQSCLKVHYHTPAIIPDSQNWIVEGVPIRITWEERENEIRFKIYIETIIGG